LIIFYVNKKGNAGVFSGLKSFCSCSQYPALKDGVTTNNLKIRRDVCYIPSAVYYLLFAVSIMRIAY